MKMAVKSLDTELLSLFLEINDKNNTFELDHLVNTHPIIASRGVWKPYGGNENNLGTFRSQQDQAIPALVEKITNSIDAYLIKLCRESGIDPKGPFAPRTMEEVVQQFFNVKNGNWKTLVEKTRKEIASNVQILHTGDSKETPNVLIYDNGEGQQPEDFEHTFLSLHKGNKVNISFVQGQFNMGSTGAVIFCGGQRYQLIASKKAFKEDGKSNKFGFTLVRKHPFASQEEEEMSKASWYEFLTIDGEIPSFEIDELDVGLVKRKFQTGSLVKLFSYKLPKEAQTVMAFGLWEILNQYLYKPAMPLLTHDLRKKNGNIMYAGHGEKVMFGNWTRIAGLEQDKKVKTLFYQAETEKIGKMTAHVHLFPRDHDNRKYIAEKAVIFTMNGQVQGSLGRVFISKELGFDMLRDTTLIHVDCTEMRKSFREEIFMSSRDRLTKDSSETVELLEKLKEMLSDDETLSALNHERRESLRRADKKEDLDVFKDVVAKIQMSDEMIKLFKDNNYLNLKAPSSAGKTKKRDEAEPKIEKRKYETKYFPEIFELSSKRDLNIPKNEKGVWKFDTDAEDNYFTRSDQPGKIDVAPIDGSDDEFHQCFNVTVAGPSNGVIRLTVQPKEQATEGRAVSLAVALLSNRGDLIQRVTLAVLPEAKKEQPPEKKSKKDAGRKGTTDSSIPKPHRVHKELWNELGWGAEDILKLNVRSAKGVSTITDVYVNMDSEVLKSYIRKNKLRTEKQVKAAQNDYFFKMYFHSLFLYLGLQGAVKEDETQTEADEVVSQMFKRTYAPFLLSFNTDKALFKMLED